jgi:galactokinase
MDDWFEQRLFSLGMSAGQASAKARLFTRAALELLEAGVPNDALRYWFVPGRIEILGKHTDYAGGRSLVCAFERGFCVAASVRLDDVVRITDVGRSDRIEFSLSSEPVPRVGNWSNYPMTVACRVAQNFPGALRGADIAFVNDLPSARG